MKIKLIDVERWKKDTLRVARQMQLDEKVLGMLDYANVSVIPRGGGKNFYGRAYFKPLRVEVFEENPATYFPRELWEIWNQSGMDHELIGHIYNFYARLRSDEQGARETQRDLAFVRGNNNLLWRIAAIAEPFVRTIQKYRNKLLNT